MALILSGAGGQGFQLFTQLNGSPGIYADEAARDAFFAANPLDLSRLDADQFLIIKLLDDGSGGIAYQQRSVGVFVDVTSLVQGETGPPGATGNSYFFSSITARDDFFGIPGNEALLETDLPIVVNTGSNIVTSFTWTGATAPPSYDNSLWQISTVQTGPASLIIGSNKINQGGRFLTIDSDLDGSTSFMITREYDSASGSDVIKSEKLAPEALIDVLPFTGTRFTIPRGFEAAGPAAVTGYQSTLDLFIYNEFTNLNITSSINSFDGPLTTTVTNFNSGPVPEFNITAITQSNPVLVTAPGHTYVDGERRGIGGIASGMTEINDLVGVVANISGDTFELVGIDSTAFTAYTSGGTSRGKLVIIPGDNLNAVDPSLFYFTTFTADQAFDVDGLEVVPTVFIPYAEIQGYLTLEVQKLITDDGNGQVDIEILRLLDSDKSNGLILKAADVMTADYTIKLPAAPGVEDQVLKLDSSLDFQWGDAVGQVDTVNSGTNITVDDTDPLNPIVNLDSDITGTSVNGVTLTAAGSSSNFLNESGNYVSPAGGSNTELQFNNTGVLDGISGITTDGTNLLVSSRIEGDGPGGLLNITGADSATSAGGDLFVEGGDAGTSGGGGSIILKSGDASGAGEDSGDITIDAGSTVDGNVGDILLARSTGQVGIGNTFVDPSALLELTSASLGILMPRMTTAEKLNISNPANGLEVYDVTLNSPFYFDGSNWEGTAGNETLSQVLADGNISGGSNLIMSDGDTLEADKLTYNNSPDVTNQIESLVRPGQVGHIDQAVIAGQSSDLSPTGGPSLSMAISFDGNHAFVGDNISQIRAYPLSTPWDITTAGAQSGIFNPGFSVGSLNISNDGLQLITHQNGGGIVRQATMTAPWDLSTASTTASATPTGPLSGNITGIAVSPDGHNLYILSGTTGEIFQYFMGTPYSVATLGLTPIKTHTISQTNNVADIAFSNDGRIVYFQISTSLFEYALGLAWDVSTIGTTFTTSSIGESTTRGGAIKPDGTRIYQIDFTTPENHFTQFDIGLVTSNIITEGNAILARTSGSVGVNTTDPKTNVHIVTDGTVSALSASLADRGLVITGSDNRTRLYFELPNTTTNKRVFSVGHEQDALKFMAHTNDGGAILQQNLITLQSEGPIGMGVAVADSSAQLELGGTLRGFLQTRLTETQRDAISNPANGLSLHNTDTRRPQFFDDLDGAGGAWNKISIVAPTTVEIFTAADLDDLATGGVITVATGTNLVLDFKPDSITTDVSFVIEGSGTLSIQSSNPNAKIFYTDSVTYISGVFGALTIARIDVIATGTATLLSLIGATTASVVDIQNAILIEWDDLGTLNSALLGIALTQLVLIDSGLVISDVSMGMVSVNIVAPLITGNFITIEPGSLTHSFTISGGSANVGSNALVRIDPGITSSSTLILNKMTMVSGELFDTTGGATGTFTAVADATVASTTIDSVADLAGLASFNFTIGPTLFIGQEITISGFITNTAYNGTFIIISEGPGVFVVDVPFGTDEATGSFSGDSVTLTDTGTTLVSGDTLVIDTTDSTDYDGGATVYNQQTNSFQINRTFGATETGTWDTAGIDQADPRILGSSNPGFIDSKALAFSDVNNHVGTTSITDGAYAPLQAQTMISRPSTERFKQVNSIGIWEYSGNEPFEGLFIATIHATKSGATANYRFATTINQATPTFATEPYTPMEVKGTKVGVTMLAPISMDKGDQVQIMVAGDGTSDDITLTDVLVSIQ